MSTEIRDMINNAYFALGEYPPVYRFTGEELFRLLALVRARQILESEPIPENNRKH
jgi:hypothetical protein